MRPTLRPRLLGHLRDMLSEKEEDLQTLRQRLQVSEEFQGEALSRLERLESHFGVAVNGYEKAKPASGPSLSARLDVLERHAGECKLLGKVSGAHGAFFEADLGRRLAALEAAAGTWQATGKGAGDETVQQLHASQRLVEQLREQLHISNAGRAALVGESQRWQHEAEALRREAGALRQEAQALRSSSRAAAFRAEAQLEASSASREVEALRGRLAESIREASLLRTQLAARAAEVARLELRVAELESAALSAGGGTFDTGTNIATALGQPASFGGSGSGVFARARPEGDRAGLDHKACSLRQTLLDATRQVRPGEVREETAGTAVNVLASSSRPVSRQVSPQGVRRQASTPGALPAAATTQAATVSTSATSSWPESPEAPPNAAADLQSVQRLPVRMDPQRMTSTPATSSTSPSTTWFAPATAAPTLAEASVTGVSTAPRTNLNRSSSPTRLLNVTGATAATSSPEWPAPAADASLGLITRLAQSTASSTFSPDPSAAATGAAAAKQLQQQPPALDGMPVMAHRSQSVPVSLRHGGVGAGGQVQTVGGPNGVSLARWAASPGEGRRSVPGENRRSAGVARALGGGLHPTQTLAAQPTLAQVLGGGGMGVAAASAQANPFMGQVVRR